jgi:hypothetical protein
MNIFIAKVLKKNRISKYNFYFSAIYLNFASNNHNTIKKHEKSIFTYIPNFVHSNSMP